MKEPRTPDRKKGGRRPVLAKESSNAKLFADDYVTVGKLIKSSRKTESEVIRIIVYDWLRANRVRALGQDEAAEAVRGVYEPVVSEQVAHSCADRMKFNRAVDFHPPALPFSPPRGRLFRPSSLRLRSACDAKHSTGPLRGLFKAVPACSTAVALNERGGTPIPGGRLKGQHGSGTSNRQQQNRRRGHGPPPAEA
jgi:hypothetical protein